MIYIIASWGMRRHQAPIAALIAYANCLGRVEEKIKGETDIDIISALIQERHCFEEVICKIVGGINDTTVTKPY